MPETSHHPSATVRFSPCSGVCQNFGCGSPKAHPPTLTATLNFAVSCPGVPGNVVTVTLVNDPVAADCAAVAAAGCVPAEGITPPYPFMCLCNYQYNRDPADILACGPYLQSVSMRAVNPAAYGFADGPPAGCPHVGRPARGMWLITIVWARTDGIAPALPDCPLTFPPGPIQHPVQQADCSWLCVDGAGDPECNPDCPKCIETCGYHDRQCAAGLQCCGTTNCFEWFTTDELPCTRCWHSTDASAEDPECECSSYKTGRQYTFAVTDCGVGPDDIKGCNPVSCPPDDKNTGDFELFYGCLDLSGDWIHIGCNAETMAASMAARHVAILTDAEVDAALAAQLALGA